jgi:signal transduction histidine kinase
MSHEIRTPLNAIIGFSEMISSEVLGPVGTSRYRDYANDIYDSGQHLLRIINDVLDMSKIGAGKLELHEHLVDVRTAVQTSIALVTPRAVSAGVVITADLPANLPFLLADELRLKQILLNLLSNAVKFTNRLGSATVAATARADGSLALTVSDTGIGMTAAEIAIALEYEGTGLGLPLARALAELHGGRLEIASTPGHGTTVTVILPASRVRPREKSPTAPPAA